MSEQGKGLELTLAALERGTVYETSEGRRGFMVFHVLDTGYAPVHDREGNARIAYLRPDGTEPPPPETEYAWVSPATLTAVGRAVLPPRDVSGVEDVGEDCPHERTSPASVGEPYQRECLDCDARLHLTPEQDKELAIRDDGGFYVTSLDGSLTYAGPFVGQAEADEAAERVEAENPGLVTDISFEKR